jgi:FSR family fosmidomycin resistance protein-like MFS transporter
LDTTTTQTPPEFLENPAPPALRFDAARVATIATGHGLHDTFTAFLPPLLPVLIEKFSLVNVQAGLLTIFMQAPSILQPFIGYMADRRSLRAFVAATPAITAIAMSFIGVAPSYILIALFLLVAGFSSAVLHSTGPVLAGRLSGDRLGLGMSFWMVGGELGRTIGPIVIVNAITYLGPQRTPLISIVGIIISVMIYIQLGKVHEGKQANALYLPWRDALVAMKPVLIPLTGFIIARSFTNACVGTFLPTYLTEKGASLVLAGVSLSVMEAAGVLGAFLGGSLSDRLGRRPILLFSIVFTAVFTVLLMLADGWIEYPILLGLGFALLCSPPAFMAIVQESYPDNRALANGVYMAISFLSQTFSVIAVGRFADVYNMHLAFLVSSAVILFGIYFVFRLPEKRKALAELP